MSDEDIKKLVELIRDKLNLSDVARIKKRPVEHRPKKGQT